MLNTKFLESTKGILVLKFMEAIEVIACIPQDMAVVAHEQSLYTFSFSNWGEEILPCSFKDELKALEWWKLHATASVVSASAHTGDTTRVQTTLGSFAYPNISLSWEERSVLVSTCMSTAEVVDRPCDPEDLLESCGPADWEEGNPIGGLLRESLELGFEIPLPCPGLIISSRGGRNFGQASVHYTGWVWSPAGRQDLLTKGTRGFIPYPLGRLVIVGFPTKREATSPGGTAHPISWACISRLSCGIHRLRGWSPTRSSATLGTASASWGAAPWRRQGRARSAGSQGVDWMEWRLQEGFLSRVHLLRMHCFEFFGVCETILQQLFDVCADLLYFCTLISPCKKSNKSVHTSNSRRKIVAHASWIK